jgi:peptide/nickel transport system permease protein
VPEPPTDPSAEVPGTGDGSAGDDLPGIGDVAGMAAPGSQPFFQHGMPVVPGGSGGAATQVELETEGLAGAVDDLGGLGVIHYGTDSEGFDAREVAMAVGRVPAKRRRGSLLKRLGWGFWFALGWVALVALGAILAGVLPLPDPNAIPAPGCTAYAGPSAGHLLGCDELGRDVFSRVVYGARVSLVVGFASIALALAVGGAAGVVAGYLRGAFDSVSGVLSNVLLAYPYLILALAIVTFWGHSEFNVTVVIAIVAVAPLFRVVRANTIAFSERDYVLAARALGSTRKRVLKTLIIPDVIPAAITYGLVGVALAITGEGALSYLGQSVSSTTTPTWGNMINEGAAQISSIGSPVPVNIWVMLGPAIAMFLFILAISVMGDRLRALLDVRTNVL